MAEVLKLGSGEPDALGREVAGDWDSLYWAYNCPLQMWPDEGEWRVVNYMPRRESADEMEAKVSEADLPAFCRNAAKTLRNLADLFEALERREIDTIYYPDETVAAAIESMKSRTAGG